MADLLLVVTTFLMVAAVVWAWTLQARLRRLSSEDSPPADEPEAGDRGQELNQALLDMARRGGLSGEEIEDSLRKATEIAAASLDVARVGVWLFQDETPHAIRCIHLFEADGGRHTAPETVISQSDAPSYFAAIRSSRIVDAETAHDDPRTRQLGAYLVEGGVDALLDAPIRVAGELKGIVCHEHRGGPRRWLPEEKQFAASVGDLVSGILEATERRRTEAELALARSRTLQILDTITDAFFHLDPELRFTYLNPEAQGWVEKLGRDPDELLGQQIWEAFQLDSENPGRLELKRALTTGEAVHYTHHSHILDRCLELHAYPSSDGLAVYVRDVTERVQAEEALRESEERFRLLVERAPEAIVVVDPGSEEILMVNENMVELFQMSREELLETFPPDLSPEHQPDGRRSDVAAQEYLEKALAGEDQVFEWVHLRGDGSPVLCEVRLTRLPMGDRSVIRGSMTDITERKGAEEALRESEERYRALFQADVAGNYVVSADGIILNCNDAFARIFGFPSAEQAIGKQVVPLLESRATRDAFLQEIREHGTLRLRETEARKLDGSTVYVTENVRGVFDDDGRLLEVRGHIVDLTQRRMLEEQLRHAQRMEAVGRLAGGIAHDFNNLLTAVGGHADLLLLEEGISESVKRDVQRIKEASERATKLTRQLLAFSRRQMLRPAIVNLSEVVRGVQSMTERLLGEDIRLSFELGEVDRVHVDKSQVEQMLLNLAVNARDAMPHGGVIEVRTENVTLELEDVAPHGDLEPGRYVMLCFSDTGEGMAKEIQERIFEPFFTTKDPGKGTGLGLPMVYGFVHQTGGFIEVESEMGQGTSFRIYFPSAADRS